VLTVLHDEKENEHQQQIRRRNSAKGGAGAWKSGTFGAEIHSNPLTLKATSSLYMACIALALITYMGMGGKVLHSLAGVSTVAFWRRSLIGRWLLANLHLP
jgi:hypothetical protein